MKCSIITNFDVKYNFLVNFFKKTNMFRTCWLVQGYIAKCRNVDKINNFSKFGTNGYIKNTQKMTFFHVFSRELTQFKTCWPKTLPDIIFSDIKHNYDRDMRYSGEIKLVVFYIVAVGCDIILFKYQIVNENFKAKKLKN